MDKPYMYLKALGVEIMNMCVVVSYCVDTNRSNEFLFYLMCHSSFVGICYIVSKKHFFKILGTYNRITLLEQSQYSSNINPDSVLLYSSVLLQSYL